ncbi:hypothetical protein C6497_12290 [Candidatus Poribacteria bacterium]|nr:MAG: hypothetical protein C6497_12290 [Candidatus Poribacteria bacterium]
MFIRTNEELINIEAYQGIFLDKHRTTLYVRRIGDPTRDRIASYPTEDQALDALDSLHQAMIEGKQVWDARSIKWRNKKQDTI